MSVRLGNIGLALRLAILLAFLAGQSLAFAHELEHIREGETEHCSTCAIGTNLETATLGEQPPEWPEETSASTDESEAAAITLRTVSPYHGRAPPSATHR